MPEREVSQSVSQSVSPIHSTHVQTQATKTYVAAYDKEALDVPGQPRFGRVEKDDAHEVGPAAREEEGAAACWRRMRRSGICMDLTLRVVYDEDAHAPMQTA